MLRKLADFTQKHAAENSEDRETLKRLAEMLRLRADQLEAAGIK